MKNLGFSEFKVGSNRLFSGKMIPEILQEVKDGETLYCKRVYKKGWVTIFWITLEEQDLVPKRYSRYKG